MSRETTTLKEAEKALLRGEYRECLSSLELLLKEDSLESEKGAKIGILIITALIGQGETQKAISICQILTKHKSETIRQQAKQYLSILNSPELAKPEEWSITIPDLSISEQLTISKKDRQKKANDSTFNPPTGSTKYLRPGFTILTLILLILLTWILSGCVDITTKINITGPDLIKVNWDIKSNSSELIPWQENFQASLKKISPKLSIETDQKGRQIITSPSLSSKNANKLLKKTISIASENAGFEIPQAEINLVEKNWLIGIDQNLDFSIDLRELPKVPGLKLGVKIDSKSIKNPPKGYPLDPSLANNEIAWELEMGSINNLSFHRWQWGKIGIGSLLILSIMIFSMILQYLKRQMGLGFPELPP